MSQKYIEQLEACPDCGSGHIGWCGTSVRPYCRECNCWGDTNHYPNGPDVAIKNWNEKSKRVQSKNDKSMVSNSINRIEKELKYLKVILED